MPTWENYLKQLGGKDALQKISDLYGVEFTPEMVKEIAEVVEAGDRATVRFYGQPTVTTRRARVKYKDQWFWVTYCLQKKTIREFLPPRNDQND